MGPVALAPPSKYFAPEPVKVIGPLTGPRKTAVEFVETRISEPATPETALWKIPVAPPVTTILPIAVLLTGPENVLAPAAKLICPEFERACPLLSNHPPVRLIAPLLARRPPRTASRL